MAFSGSRSIPAGARLLGAVVAYLPGDPESLPAAGRGRLDSVLLSGGHRRVADAPVTRSSPQTLLDAGCGIMRFFLMHAKSSEFT
jgi:hypothetical protein